MELSAGAQGETKVILADAGGHKLQGPKSDGKRCTSSDTSRRQKMTMDQMSPHIRATRQM